MDSSSTRCLIGTLLYTLCLPLFLHGNEAEMFCAHTKTFAAPALPDSPDYRKYAPDREIDILHLVLDVTPDFKQRTVTGTATWKFKPIAKPFGQLSLDAVDITVAA